ncbi:unnamed protein product [Closterium sp. Yama58-4]|nr:unnamed protein product [Closterium sp. Yama58-4]
MAGPSGKRKYEGEEKVASDAGDNQEPPQSAKESNPNPNPGLDSDGKPAGSKPKASPAEPQPAKQSEKTCVHDVALPPDFTSSLDESVHGTIYAPVYKGPMAKTYPFELDPFQATSVACLERRESVLVAAHTSAGKTAVAEYAIAMAFRDKQRVIYTSPLKALSNQKYRELSEEFSDVGLMTGDVTIAPNAACIVMTTEILRSMLYRGSEVLREVAWVIFDEIHYMRDRERGVVWEESIIFLPPDVKMVFLSATLSNAREFVEWITYLHKQPCHVVYTDYRPTPLQHFAFPYGGDGLYLMTCSELDFHPMIVFSFRRRECEAYAMQLSKLDFNSEEESKMVKECEAYAMQLSKLDFNSEEESKMVKEVFNNAISVLPTEDQDLPAVRQMLPLLQRGVGVHHSGLLPILKELIEILFQEGLLKVLFATETFAMGLNMPARTVVFTATHKWDGEANRAMHSGEYIQMSGRAGRRGKDSKGIVIVMVNEEMTMEACKEMMLGKPAPLESSFRLTYYALLNLMARAEGQFNAEHVIAHSFHQFQHDRQVPEVEKRIKELQAEADALEAGTEDEIREYHALRLSLAEKERRLKAEVLRPDRCLHFLQPGRLIRVVDGLDDWGWGVIVNVMKQPSQNNSKSAVIAPSPTASAAAAAPLSTTAYLVDTLLLCSPVVDSGGGEGSTAQLVPRPCALDGNGEMHVIPVKLPAVARIGALRIALPTDLRPKEARQAVLVTLRDVTQRFPGGLPILDPVEDMGITDESFLDLVHSIDQEESKLAKHPLFKSAQAEEVGIPPSHPFSPPPTSSHPPAPILSLPLLVHSPLPGAEQKLEVLKRRGQLLAEAQRLKMKTRESQLLEVLKRRGQLLAETQRLKMKTREPQLLQAAAAGRGTEVEDEDKGVPGACGGVMSGEKGCGVAPFYFLRQAAVGKGAAAQDEDKGVPGACGGVMSGEKGCGVAPFYFLQQAAAGRGAEVENEDKGVTGMFGGVMSGAVGTSVMRNRSRVLKRLGHIDADGVVQLKGRAACVSSSYVLNPPQPCGLDELKLKGRAACVSSSYVLNPPQPCGLDELKLKGRAACVSSSYVLNPPQPCGLDELKLKGRAACVSSSYVLNPPQPCGLDELKLKGRAACVSSSYVLNPPQPCGLDELKLKDRAACVSCSYVLNPPLLPLPLLPLPLLYPPQPCGLDELQLKGRVACVVTTGDELLVTELMLEGGGAAEGGGDGVVQLKGRAVCVVTTGDELLVTELMLEGAFNSMDPHQLVAVASCFLPSEKSNEEQPVAADLKPHYNVLREAAQHIARVQIEEKIEVDEEEYVDQFRPTLMNVFYQWSKGELFGKVIDSTDAFEGTIVRVARRLDELLNEMKLAAQAIGELL